MLTGKTTTYNVEPLTGLTESVSGLRPRFNARKIINGIVEVWHNIKFIRIDRKRKFTTPWNVVTFQQAVDQELILL